MVHERVIIIMAALFLTGPGLAIGPQPETQVDSTGCITGFKISGFTGDLGSAGFSERHSHRIIFNLTDGTDIKNDIQGPIFRNQPFELEFALANETCISLFNITQVYLKAGGNDDWYIREIYTYCKVKGNTLYLPLNADPLLYKWLDGKSVIYLKHSFISRSVVLAGSQVANELNATTSRLEALESDLNIRLNETDDRLNEASKRLDNTADNLESLKTDVATIEQLETLKSNFDKLESEFDAKLESDLEFPIIEQLETLESNLNETDDRLSEASKDLDNVTKNIESLKSNLESLKTDLDAVATIKQLETLESNLNDTDYRLSEASKKVDNSTNNLESLKSNLDAVATIEQLEMLESLLNSSLGVILEKVEMLQQQMTNFHLFGITPSNPAASCADILNRNASSLSGYYWIISRGVSRRQYCNMTLSCGGVTGGWLRVAELDMTNSSHQCPSGLRQRTYSGKRTCGVNSNSGICSSVTFPIKSSGYSKVCGKIIAYQVGSTDGFADYGNRNTGINGNYVDGVSLTHGNPRRHVWTFVAALHEHNSDHSSCPCIVGTNANYASRPPAFIGNDYFCDTGSAGYFQYGVFYSGDPLWDGAGCGSQNTCCSFNNPPWFYKQLSQPTTDNIEMRLCRDESSTNEDIPVEMIDIYVQ